MSEPSSEFSVRLTDANPTGIMSFDHSALPGQPERRELLLALRTWARKLAPEDAEPDEPIEPMLYAEWLRTLHQLAASLAFADATHHCPRIPGGYDPDNYERNLHFPVRAEVDAARDNLTATYHCLECGGTWTCGYSLEYPLWTG